MLRRRRREDRSQRRPDCGRRVLSTKLDDLRPGLVPLLVEAQRVLARLISLLTKTNHERLRSLGVQGSSLLQQFRPILEGAKFELMALIPIRPLPGSLRRPRECCCLIPRQTCGSFLLKTLLGTLKRLRDREVFR